MYNLKFNKVNKNKYVVDNGRELILKAFDIVKDISGDVDSYEIHSTMKLVDSLISRMVAREFFLAIENKEVEELDSNLTFASLSIDIQGRLLNVTVGLINIDNISKKINGCSYI